MRVIGKIKHFIWKRKRKKINNKNILRLTNRDVSIISCNCTGGILSHDLNLRFMSPTVNLFMRAEDFIKFCERLEYYLSIDEIIECLDKDLIQGRTYPIGCLDDIVLFFVHYKTIKEAREKWNDRKKRVDFNNLVVINTDREGMTENIKQRFEKLPYKKVLFTNRPEEKYKSCFYIKGYEAESSVGIITESIGWRGKRVIDQFDYVTFFNEASIND